MEERLRSDLASSPLYSFVQQGWLEWGQEIVSVQVREEDFLLYVLWGLDLIKQEGMDVCKNFRSKLYMGLRTHFLDSGYTPHQNDLEYLSNLACACCLYCYGLILTHVHDATDVYSNLVNGFGKHWSNVKAQWDTVKPDMNTPDLKEWIIEYVKSEEYYTSGERIAWLNEDGSAALVNIPGIAGGKQQLSVHNYIQNFHNEAGAVFKDESVTLNVQQNFGKQNESPVAERENKVCESGIRLAESFAKVDLQRVIIALIKLGAFETDKGTEIKQKEVFEAFGKMLGTDLSKYSRAFSDASYNKSEEGIFRKLENAFRTYEAQKAAKKESLK